MDDRKFIEVYVCQKLSYKVKFWRSYCKNKTVQFFASHGTFRFHAVMLLTLIYTAI